MPMPLKSSVSHPCFANSASPSSVEMMNATLAKYDQHEAELNTTVFLRQDLPAIAAEHDRRREAGERLGPLHGLPILVKDNVDVAGMVTSNACELFRHGKACGADAPVVAALRAAGAIVIGKANLDELAAHVSGRTSCLGPTINPWKREQRLSPGGSSSGCAAAVAAGMVCAAVGTDTGGSIRIPASWCGVCGLRPTLGLLSTQGVFPRAKSMDTPGFLAGSVADIALLLGAACNRPSVDGASLSCAQGEGPRKLAVVYNSQGENMSAETWQAHVNAVGNWSSVASIELLEFPLLFSPEVETVVNNIRAHEFYRDVYADLSAQPGWEAKVSECVLTDLRLGASISSADYAAALSARDDAARQVSDFLEQCGADAMLLPAVEFEALPLDASLDRYRQARRCVNLASMTGNPTLVVPAGLVNGLPFGMQLVGKVGGDDTLLSLGMAYEQRFGPFPVAV